MARKSRRVTSWIHLLHTYFSLGICSHSRSIYNESGEAGNKKSRGERSLATTIVLSPIRKFIGNPPRSKVHPPNPLNPFPLRSVTLKKAGESGSRVHHCTEVHILLLIEAPGWVNPGKASDKFVLDSSLSKYADALRYAFFK